MFSSILWMVRPLHNTRQTIMMPRALSPLLRTSLAAVCLALAVLSAACATNPVTGKRELSLMSEAQEIAIGRRPTPKSAARWVSTTIPSCSAMSPISASVSPALASAEPAVDVHGRRSPGGQRVCAARRLHLHHPRHPAVSRRRGRARRRAGARDRACHRAACGAAIHARDRRRLGLAVLGIFVPATQPFGDLARSALSVAFLKYGRDDERESDRLGIEYASQGRLGPDRRPPLPADAGADGRTQRARRAQLAVHASRARARASSKRSRWPPRPAAPTRRRGTATSFLEHIDGVVVGDNPKDGIVRGNPFSIRCCASRWNFPRAGKS